ncbi:hypothetical protein AMS68_005045 [Peltaster fructicola]|uniref:Uncharacterized protein n=1 Tax=Peltaster fructicola TaxID=286661 RepID=A0A6H0XY60_9PEZI|nr:hypothetical protein AMS68_005045 [Peltaster fructicola]
MPSRSTPRSAMYNTPIIRTGGFGALQVEAITNRPQSIARRHYAASQLRMRDIEPDELSSSEWLQFLVMEERERDRWMGQFVRQRRLSAESSSSAGDREVQHAKAEEARLDAEEARRAEDVGSSVQPPVLSGQTPAVSAWVRQFDSVPVSDAPTARRPLHARRAVTDFEAPPAYNSVTRTRTPPPAYEPRSDDDEPISLTEMRRPAQMP